MAKSKKPTRQLAFRVPEELAQRTEKVAARLGLDLSNFLRTILLENIVTYEVRANRAEQRLPIDPEF